LLTKEETGTSMRAPREEAKELARPLPNDALIPSSREPYGSTIVSKSAELVEQGSLLRRLNPGLVSKNEKACRGRKCGRLFERIEQRLGGGSFIGAERLQQHE
jgi:hypothetical protein